MRHPTTETILDFLENKADSANRHSLNEHLASCSRCESKSEEFRQLTGFLQADAANEPPTHLLDWGVGLFQPVLRPQEGTLRRIFGTLVFDSFEQPLPAGIRHVGSIPRQLLFRAGDVDVDVRIDSDTEDRVSLAGLVGVDRLFRKHARLAGVSRDGSLQDADEPRRRVLVRWSASGHLPSLDGSA